MMRLNFSSEMLRRLVILSRDSSSSRMYFFRPSAVAIPNSRVCNSTTLADTLSAYSFSKNGINVKHSRRLYDFLNRHRLRFLYRHHFLPPSMFFSWLEASLSQTAFITGTHTELPSRSKPCLCTFFIITEILQRIILMGILEVEVLPAT